MALRERGNSSPFEKEYLRRDGTRVSVLIVGTILPGPEEQLAAFVLDLTERKLAERQVREQNEILSNSDEGVMIVSVTRKVTAVEPRGREDVRLDRGRGAGPPARETARPRRSRRRVHFAGYGDRARRLLEW
jgi:PAS domain-containing protein